LVGFKNQWHNRRSSHATKKQPARTINRVLSASLKLFKEKGFDKTSMQDIVEASDMSKGAIFYHFKSKEEVFEAAMDMQFSIVKQRFSEFLKQLDGETAKEKLKKLIIANFIDEDINIAVYDMLRINAGSAQLILSDMRNNVKEVAPIVTELIKEGIADGSIDSNFPDELGEVFVLLYNHWCDMHVFRCGLSTLHRRLAFLQHMMAKLGCDIISDEMIEHCLKIDEHIEKIYNEVQND